MVRLSPTLVLAALVTCHVILASTACVGDEPAAQGNSALDATSPADAAPDGGGEVDASQKTDGGRCDPTAAFGSAEVIDELATVENQPAAWLSEDELTVYLARSNGAAGVDLYSASRLVVTAKFGAPALLDNVNSNADDDNPTVTRDGLHLFFHSGRRDDAGPGALRLFVASRQFTVQPFSAPVLVEGIPPIDVNQLDPFISPSGNTLYFGQSNLDPTSVDQNIWVAERAPDAGFQPPVMIDELSLPTTTETQPILTADERVVYFTSNRDGGNFDIWRASRPERTARFSAPERVVAASSTLIDTPTWISADDCELWIARGEKPAKRDLLRLRRPRNP